MGGSPCHPALAGSPATQDGGKVGVIPSRRSRSWGWIHVAPLGPEFCISCSFREARLSLGVRLWWLVIECRGGCRSLPAGPGFPSLQNDTGPLSTHRRSQSCCSEPVHPAGPGCCLLSPARAWLSSSAFDGIYQVRIATRMLGNKLMGSTVSSPSSYVQTLTPVPQM